MLRRTPLARKTPLKATGALKRTQGLRAKGQTTAERKWRAAVLDAAGNRCQFPNCTKTEGLEANHINSRAQRPDLKLDRANGNALCTQHHQFVTDNPDAGTGLGLIRHDRYEKRARDE